jgi:hypothetical protein
VRWHNARESLKRGLLAGVLEFQRNLLFGDYSGSGFWIPGNSRRFYNLLKGAEMHYGQRFTNGHVFDLFETDSHGGFDGFNREAGLFCGLLRNCVQVHVSFFREKIITNNRTQIYRL